ncbi:MAG: glycoside hydrolase family 3 N-terminal domain-containing protein [Actinomycetes bacterium]
MATWPLSRLAAQVLIAPAQLTDVRAAAPQVKAGIGGLILFGSSVPFDLPRQIAQLRNSAPGGVPPLVMTDEEGGAVQRMADLVGPIPSARHMASKMSRVQIERLAETLGAQLRQAGITMDLAPVLDLDAGVGPNSEDPDGTRSFGIDSVQTSRDALSFASGLRAAGVIPVVKHFPGLGAATGNTDDGPAATLPWKTLRRDGLRPFRDAINAGISAVMVANATVPGLTSLPASISPTVIKGVLRRQLHFRGLVMTDSVSALALGDIGYPVPDAAVAALRAGADMVLFGTGTEDDPRLTHMTVRAITRAVESGSILRRRIQDAAEAVLSAKNINLCHPRSPSAQ